VNTKLHRPLSLMRALWGCMKMPPWLNILSTGADVAGTQYMRLTKCCWHLNWSLLRMASTLAFCIFYLSNWPKQASIHMKWVWQIHGWSWKIVQDRHFETKPKTKTGSAETKTKTAKNRSQVVSRPRSRSRGLQDSQLVAHAGQWVLLWYITLPLLRLKLMYRLLVTVRGVVDFSQTTFWLKSVLRPNFSSSEGKVKKWSHPLSKHVIEDLEYVKEITDTN